MGADVLGGLAGSQRKGLLIVVLGRGLVGQRWRRVGCLQVTGRVCETERPGDRVQWAGRRPAAGRQVAVFK